MSNEAITWAYRQPISTGAKFVLVALADLADESHSCYPGQKKLAVMTGQGERTVRRQLLELELAGYVSRARRFDKAGHRTSDRYVLPVGQEIPTGQNGQWPNQPPVKVASGQDDRRSSVQSLPAIDDSPTGQNGRVSLREPTDLEPTDLMSANADATKPSREVVAIRQDVERLCAHLADRIQTNGSKRPQIGKRWRDAGRLLIDADEKTEQQVHAAIDWCQDDEFWRGNILSMPKLRDKYDQLRLQAQRGHSKRDEDGQWERAIERARERDRTGTSTR